MKLTIALRMKLLIGAAVLGLVVLQATSMVETAKVYEEASYGNVNVVPSLLILGSAQAEFQELTRNGYQHALSTDMNDMQQLEIEIQGHKQAIDKDLEKYKTLFSDDEDKKLWENVKKDIATYIVGMDKALSLSRLNKNDLARAELNKNLVLAENVNSAFTKHFKYNQSLGEKSGAVALAAMTTSKAVGITTALLITLGMIVFGWLILKTLFKQLGTEPSELSEMASRFAKGDLSEKIDIHNLDASSVTASLSTLQTALKKLVADADMLSVAAVEGKLATRADANQHQGDYRKVVVGVNATLDSVIGPLNIAANYVDRISKGDIPPKITDAYNGDFNTIKNNLNTCIDAVNAMVAEAGSLEKAAIEGRLSTRADTSKYQGDFRKIVEGVNNCLDAVIDPLNVAAKYVEDISKGSIPAKITDTYNGDFNTIKNNLNQCIDAVNAMIADAGMLANAAEQGLLSTRADASKHQGDFRKIVQGVNDTLDYVIDPLNVAADYVDHISKGNVPARITDHYNGDFNVIKNNLNTCVDAVNRLVADANMLAEAAADGRVTTRADVSAHQGDFRKVVEGVNATLETIVAPIAAVKEAIETITTAANEIATGNNDLSQRTEQQASSLEETAASMEELASTVKNNAENAKQANQLAAAASGVAIKGGEVVGQVVNTMSAINTSAKKIEDIISVIDGIAFQTNILALNAAVEAARAGEQGRGFAVVAGEVRNLAQRSASAAKEIKELITDSVSKTAEGTAQVEQAGKTMADIVSSVQRVTDIMGEITAASVEQSAGIDQVNTAVTSMDEVTQQNAALVEEAAAAAESLVEQAIQLSDVVSVFKLDGGGSGNNRRAPNSALRALVKTPQAVASKAAPKLLAKTGTHDDEWEAF